MTVLYRKYRPKRFDDYFIGQEIAKKILTNSVVINHIGHAYLFCGLKGSGKTTSARIFAKAINCENSKNEKGNPCGKCKSCNLIQNNQALDIIEIDAASNRGIDEIREIRDQVKTTPVNLTYKVYIIDEVHMLTRDAFNALLKTIEEPPEHAVFILVTTEAEKIPDTILSRVQRLDFKPLSLEELSGSIKDICKEEGVKIEEGAVESIVRAAGGSPRDALSILDKMIVLQGDNIEVSKTNKSLGIVDTKEVVDFVNILIYKSLIEAINFYTKLEESGFKMNIFLESLISYLRVITLFKVDRVEAKSIVEGHFANDFIIEAEKVYSSVDGRTLVEWLKKFIAFRKDNHGSNEDKYAFDVLLMDIWSARSESSVFKKDSNPQSSSLIGEEVKSKTDYNVKKSSIEKKVEEEVNKEGVAASCDVEEVKQVWPSLVASIKNFNHGVFALLKVCRPVEVSKAGEIIIGCTAKFHQTQLQSGDTTQKIKEELDKLLGKNTTIKFEHRATARQEEISKNQNDPEEERKEEHEGADVKDALEVFGGKVVS